MCGILGAGGPRGEELVRRLLPDLAHRGPDGDGVWSSSELALGHRRLAIIGLDEGGLQPMHSASGDSLIVFNGEIYNYLELADRLEEQGRRVDRRYDTAILLEALETWGVEALPELDGMFAFAWYRPRERRLLLARDRWGKKPLFWGRVELGDGSRALLFSSELRSFTRAPGGPPPTDPLGVARYLVYDGMPGRRTVYRDVWKVPAGTWLELEPDGDVQREGRYFELAIEPGERPAPRPREQLLEELERALLLRLRSDVPVGLFLSGGIDSSLLAAVWRRVQPEGEIRTFTVGFEDPSYDERAAARLVARTIGAEHREILFSEQELERELEAVWEHLSEPFGDPSIVPTSLVCRFAAREVKVALGGDGADELQAGYDPFRAWRTARNLERLLPRRLWHRILRSGERLLPADPSNMSLGFKAHHFAQGFLHPPEERIQGWMASFPLHELQRALRPELLAEIDVEEVLEPSRRAFLAAARHGELAAQMSTWIATYLESSILTKVDRASMMHSLEVRSPFLDPELASFLLALPTDLVFRRGRGKRLLRELGGELLPAETLARPKKGFGVPQATWLRTILRQRFEACLEASRRDGWFDHRTVETFWRRHLSGREDHRKLLWTFLFSFPFQHRAL